MTLNVFKKTESQPKEKTEGTEGRKSVSMVVAIVLSVVFVLQAVGAYFLFTSTLGNQLTWTVMHQSEQQKAMNQYDQWATKWLDSTSPKELGQ
jgi:flagellar basal body-associated protein FliL